MAPFVEKLYDDVRMHLDDVIEAGLALTHFQERTENISSSNIECADRHLKPLEQLLEEVDKMPSQLGLEKLIADEIARQVTVANDAIKKAEKQKKDFENSWTGRLGGYTKVANKDIQRLRTEKEQLLNVPKLMRFRMQLRAELESEGASITKAQLDEATRTKAILDKQLEESGMSNAKAMQLAYSIVKTKALLEAFMEKDGIDIAPMEKITDPRNIEDALINWLDDIERQYKLRLEEPSPEITNCIAHLDELLEEWPNKKIPKTQQIKNTSVGALKPDLTPFVRKIKGPQRM